MATFSKSLNVEQWQVLKADSEARTDKLLAEWLKGRRLGHKQPVLDFLFEYYSFRPARLRRWTPGAGVRLEGREADIFLEHRYFSRVEGGVMLDPSIFPAKRRRALVWMMGLLKQSQTREPYFGCYGMHEWAMVYRAEEVRHNQVPLRMDPETLAQFVESRPIRCTHYDAFRFFTPKARPLNRLQPTIETLDETEQRGCLHTNMDLYKWAYKLYPWVGSALLLDTLELAMQARRMDMRASPYDLRDKGLEPICIETSEGRAEYRSLQEALSERAMPLRDRLIGRYEVFLSLLPEVSGRSPCT